MSSSPRPAIPAQTADETLSLLRAWQDDQDRTALGELLEKNAEFVRGMVRKRLGSALREGVESLDIVQEVALDALEYGPRFIVSTREQLRAILARMVENNIRDRSRWQNRLKREVRRERRLTGSVDLSGSITRPDSRMEKAELREVVHLALELLEDDDRTVVRLHQIEERPMAEVAELLGLKPQAAHMRYQRALPRLAEKVQALLKGEGLESC